MMATRVGRVIAEGFLAQLLHRLLASQLGFAVSGMAQKWGQSKFS
jgi:hypothetical protein